MKEAEKSKLTQEFLKQIALHLSSRAECRGATYRVTISDSELTFHPKVEVFPDRHHRKSTDKVPVSFHVASHFVDMLNPRMENGKLYLDTPELVPGVYEYQPSVDGKRRRWVKIESYS